MNELRCSVVVPTYNRPEKVRGLLETLRRQVDPEVPFELVLVDDGSSPPVEVDAEGQPYPVTVVRLDTNKGRAAARNAGIERVRTPLIVFMDDDIRPVEGHIRAYVEAIDPAGRNVGVGRVAFHPDLPRDSLLEYQQSRNLAKLGPDDPIPYRYFVTNNCAVPTELIRGVGGFDERLCVWGGEDTELGMRLVQAGATFVRVDGAEALNEHRRDINEVWDVSRKFARHSMPIIFSTHPEFAKTLHADVLGPRKYADGFTLRRSMTRFVTLPPFARIVRWFVSLAPGISWPSKVYDYLIASAWRRGLDEAEE